MSDVLASVTRASFKSLTGVINPQQGNTPTPQTTSHACSSSTREDTSSSSEPGEGSRRVVAAIRLFCRLQERNLLDILLLDALLVGPFGFNRETGGATLPQLCRYLGLARPVVKSGVLALKMFLCNSTHFDDLENDSEDGSDSDQEVETKKAEEKAATRAENRIRYFVNFKAALPHVICTLSAAFVSMASVSSNQLEALFNLSKCASSSDRPPHTTSAALVYCTTCSAWVDTAHLRVGYVCPGCKGNILQTIGQDAKRMYEALRSRSITRRNMLTPQQLSLERITCDLMLLQQLLLWNEVLRHRLVYTGFEREAVNPEAYMTDREYAELQRHLQQASGLIAPSTVRAFQVRRSAQGHPPLRLKIETLGEKEVSQSKVSHSKLEKRATIPPWMVIDALAHKAAAGAKRAREEPTTTSQSSVPSTQPPTGYTPKFGHIARTFSAYNVTDL